MLITASGFDHVNNMTDVVRGPLTAMYAPYSTVVPSVVNPGRGNIGKAINIIGGGTFPASSPLLLLFKSYRQDKTTAIAGIAIEITTGSPTASVALGFYHGHIGQIYCVIDNSGTISMYLGSIGSGTLLAQTTNVPLAFGAYNFYELQGTIDPINGIFTIKVNGTSQLSINTVNTSADGTTIITDFVIGVFSNSELTSYNGNWLVFDDIYLADTTGTTPYNAPLGDIRVLTKFATANGTHFDFTPLSGSNYQNINETAMDSDATYNYAVNNGSTDTFTSTSLPLVPASVYAVMITVAAETAQGSNRQYAPRIKSGIVDTNGNTVPSLAGEYSYGQTIWTADPATTLTWTVNGVNAAEFGYSLVA